MCKCRRVEVPAQGKGKPIKGIVYCSECVNSGKAEIFSLKLLMAESLRKDLEQIRARVADLLPTTNDTIQ